METHYNSQKAYGWSDYLIDDGVQAFAIKQPSNIFLDLEVRKSLEEGKKQKQSFCRELHSTLKEQVKLESQMWTTQEMQINPHLYKHQFLVALSFRYILGLITASWETYMFLVVQIFSYSFLLLVILKRSFKFFFVQYVF